VKSHPHFTNKDEDQVIIRVNMKFHPIVRRMSEHVIGKIYPIKPKAFIIFINEKVN